MGSTSEDGTFIKWENGQSFSLSAPILRVTIADLTNDETMQKLREAFAYWVRQDRENCDLVRYGLLRFRMPDRYKVNQAPGGSLGELGNAAPERVHLTRGITTAAEAAECIGGQLGRLGDKSGALLAALFVDHLQKNYKEAFENALRWSTRVPGDLGRIVCRGLNESYPGGGGYLYQGLDDVATTLANNPVVKRYLEQE